MAATASAITKTKIVTYNAAGASKEILNKYNIPINYSSSYVDKFYVQGDVLSGLERVSPYVAPAIGSQNELPNISADGGLIDMNLLNYRLGPFVADYEYFMLHRMSNVTSALNYVDQIVNKSFEQQIA